MRIVWLEKLADSGEIRKEVLSEIYKDVEECLKIAGQNKLASEGQKVVEEVAKDLAPLAQTVEAAFPDNVEKAKARMSQILKYAPTLAGNPAVVTKLIENSLHSGFTDKDIQAIAIFNANSIKTASANISNEKVGEILADSFILKIAGPRGAITKKLSKINVKNLQPGSAVRNLAMLSMIPVGLGVGGGLVTMMSDKIRQRGLKNQLEASFHRAVDMSDADKEPLLQNREKARMAFNTLAHFAPHVALEPQAARAFMTKIVSYDQGVNPSDVKELSEITKNISQIDRPDPFGLGFGAVAKYTDAAGIVGKAVHSSNEALLGL